jgi:Flp pilus assembly protein TadD
LLAGVITLAVHWPALSCRALGFDDIDYLVTNPLVRNPSADSAGRIVANVLTPTVAPGYYHPLGILSLMLDCAMGGSVDNLRPFHVTSLVLHAMNTVLTVILLWRLFGSAWAATVAGVLFGIHPLTIEPVPWVAERKTLLSMFFALISLICYLEYVRRCPPHGSVAPLEVAPSRSASPRIARWVFYAFGALAYALSLLSKPTSVPLPILLLVLDYWPLKRLSWRGIVEKTPYFAVAALSVVITLASHSRTASLATPADQGLSAAAYVFCHNSLLYFQKMLWPGELPFFYEWPSPLDGSNPRVLAGIVATGMLVVVVAVSLRWTRAIAAGVLFFLIALFPAMGVIRANLAVAGDRFVYFPAIGILLILTAGLTAVAGPALSRRRVAFGAVGLAVLMVGVAEALATRHNYSAWIDTESLYRRMLAYNPNSGRVHYNLAIVLGELGELDEASTHYQEAIRLLTPDPAAPRTAAIEAQEAEVAKARNNLAALSTRRGRPEDALDQFARAVAQDPRNFRARSNYGAALARAGRFDEAVPQFQEALRIAPDFLPAYINMGRALFTQGRTEEAVSAMHHAARIEPRSLGAFMQLGEELAKLGRRETALVVYQEVLKIVPDHPEVKARVEALQGAP